MKKSLINLEPVRDQVKEQLIEKYNSTVFLNTSTIDIKLDVKDILEQYITDKQLTDPTVYITCEAYVKLRKLVEDTTTEIGWYGTVTKAPGLDATYIIDDIIVYPQIVTGATCVQDDDEVFNFEMRLTTDQVNRKRFHGHSHVNMGVTPSGVDEQFYQDLLSQVNDYFIIMVTNKSGANHIRFYDMENNILYTEVPLHIMLDNGIDAEHWYDEETQDNLKDRKLTEVVNKVSGNAGNFQGSIFDDYDPYESYQERWARHYDMYNYQGKNNKKNKPGRPKKYN